MSAAKHKVIGAGLTALHASGVARLAAPWTRGLGAILTFHRVTPPAGDGFAPNQGLAVAPAFFDALLGHVARQGYRFVALDAVPDLLREANRSRPFVALTFDDGTRDTLEVALPILERHAAPFTVFATTGFLDRTARLWWVELEWALRRMSVVTFKGRGRPIATAAEKAAAFETIAATLLAEDDQGLLAGVAAIGEQACVSPTDVVETLCLDWNGLRGLSKHALARIGCHTLTHPRLARLPAERARTEMADARTRLERELQVPVTSLCYPYGMHSAAGSREFAMAAALGFACAVTTRPGVLSSGHAGRLTALPRISVNGLYQTVAAVDVLLSGAGFAVWNGVQRAGGRSA